MRKHLSLFAIIAAATAACTASLSTVPGQFDDPNGAKVEVTAEGGIAALAINHRVTHDDRTFAFSQRHLCSTNCPAPSDSASGTLSSATTDSLFSIVLEQLRATPKDDFGITGQAADMMVYTVRVTSGSNVRTLHGDDGSMPASMRKIVEAVRGTISAARH